jgi:hypothetical protein
MFVVCEENPFDNETNAIGYTEDEKVADEYCTKMNNKSSSVYTYFYQEVKKLEG